MAKLKLKLLDIIALLLTGLGTVIQYIGFFLPTWWSYNDPSLEQTITLGMIQSNECTGDTCTQKLATSIEGGKEWLFITRIFEVFGLILTALALMLHLLHLPIRRERMLSASIYFLGAAGMFILAGSFVFVALYNDLAANLNPELQSVGFPYGICILAGIVILAAAVVTAIATVKKANQIDDDDDELNYVQMRR